MTEKEMEIVRNNLAFIENAKQRRANLMSHLAAVNKVAKAGKMFQVSVDLQNGDHYRRSTTIYINLSPGVVQQSLILEIEQLTREIVKRGGTVPKP